MAKTGRINFGGGGGIDPDELNAKPEHVLNDIIFGGFESDDPQKGIMQNNGTTANKSLNCGGSFSVKKGYHAQDFTVSANSLASQTSATATAGYIYSGKTAWVNGNKLTGNMTVGSILNFSAAAYSGRQILLKWQNPYAATGKPFSGVFINYSTSGYPGSGGTRIYTGSGNNNASGGWSQVIVTMPNLNTTYYFSATAYCSCSAGDFYGNVINSAAATQSDLTLTFTYSQNYTIPAGYNYMDIFCVGGGSSGSAEFDGAGGGGGGYTSTVKSITVSSGQLLSMVIGNGGAMTRSNSGTTEKGYTGSASNPGGSSSVTRSGITLCSASGCPVNSSRKTGSNGGSGGGAAGYYRTNAKSGGNGGSNGGSGSRSANGTSDYYYNPGTGQGTTTRAFGLSSGALYASGGGGGACGKYNYDNQYPSSSYDEINRPLDTRGGNGGPGGGRGGDSGFMTVSDNDEYPFSCLGTNGYAATANTGGGGGGAGGYGGRYNYLYRAGGAGGSGVALIHLY